MIGANEQCRFAEAITHGRRALELAPYNVEAHDILAYSLLSLERYEEALHYWNQGISLVPENAKMHFNMGIVYQYGLKDYDKAIQFFQRALSLDSSSDMHARVAAAHGDLRQTGEERKWLDKVLEFSLRDREAER